MFCFVLCSSFEGKNKEDSKWEKGYKSVEDDDDDDNGDDDDIAL